MVLGNSTKQSLKKIAPHLSSQPKRISLAYKQLQRICSQSHSDCSFEIFAQECCRRCVPIYRKTFENSNFDGSVPSIISLERGCPNC